MADTTELIEQALNDPAAASVDGQSVTSRTAADIIALDNHLSNKQAAAAGPDGRPVSGWARLSPARACPPGGR